MTSPKEKLESLAASVLGPDGDLSVEVRRQIEAYSAGLGGRATDGVSVPEELRTLVEKVAQRAYTTTDADIEKLKEAGLSEDAIFEAIVAAAVGAGRARYERGMAVLEGDA